jgi:hypothetical protein
VGNSSIYPKKSKRKVIALVIVVAAILAGVTYFIIYSTGNSTPSVITNFSEFQEAVKNKAAFNCEINIPSRDSEYIVSTDSGWASVFVKDAEGTNVLYLRDDAIYLWPDTESEQQAAIYNYDDEGAEFLEWLAGLSPQEVTLVCREPTDKYFMVPDKDWSDMRGKAADEE